MWKGTRETARGRLIWVTKIKYKVHLPQRTSASDPCVAAGIDGGRWCRESCSQRSYRAGEGKLGRYGCRIWVSRKVKSESSLVKFLTKLNGVNNSTLNKGVEHKLSCLDIYQCGFPCQYCFNSWHYKLVLTNVQLVFNWRDNINEEICEWLGFVFKRWSSTFLWV